MNMCLLGAEPQQPVLFLALAEQQIPPREPVGACDAPSGVLHALLVDVDPTLLDRATGLALRLGEPGLDHGVDERQAVPRRGGRGGQFQRQDLEYRVVGGVRVETAEQDFGCADDLRGRVRAVDASAKVDRKSTRLNSSHLVISYAVFCLKKKKKT